MKKVFLFMAVCLPMFIFTACNNDDDDNQRGGESIVGTWHRIFEGDEWDENEIGYETEYYADGTLITRWYNASGKVTEEGPKFLWKVEGEYIYGACLDDPKNWEREKFSISGDKLYLTDENYGETIVLTRGKISFNK